MNVGISIKDQNGQLKEMDDILDEMGAKWQTLSKDQQMALAQSVAGVRQYNQLMTLMNNWDYMQENVQVARNSDGELQK
jgi:TP901 family phage tail tape measure protein